VPDVFFVFFNVDCREGLMGYAGEVGEIAGLETVRVGLVGGLDVDPKGVMSMVEGGVFWGDFDLWSNMPSVVMERVIDRAWKGWGIEKDFDGGTFGDSSIGEVGEKAEGDMEGLTLFDDVTKCSLSDDEVGGDLWIISESCWGLLVGSIADFTFCDPHSCNMLSDVRAGIQSRVIWDEASVLWPSVRSRYQVGYPSC
jgi:hypothetical protein